MNLPLTSALDALLAPLSTDDPCGPSLRYDADVDRLRELRREDDTSLASGVWQSEPKRGEWQAVETLAQELLSGRSKDLMVAAWLGEAWLHRHGLSGLAQALALVVGLCERYPDDLHPQADEGDQSWRAAPLAWLARQYTEVLHTRVPLFSDSLGGDDGEFAHLSLFDWQRLQLQQIASDNKAAKAAGDAARLQQQKLNERIRATPIAYWQQRLAHLTASLDDLQRLDFWSDVHLQDDAPSYQPLRETLAAFAVLTQEFITMHPQQPLQLPRETPAAVVVTASSETPVQDAAPGPVSGTLNSREEAYRQLLQIADYLARTEPHSPVPYLIKRAVEWGNKPLNELLNELISADAEARRVWALLGVLK